MRAFEELEARVALPDTPREKLRAILLGVWRDIPNRNIGLANSQMEALASADPGQGKPVPLRCRRVGRARLFQA